MNPRNLDDTFRAGPPPRPHRSRLTFWLGGKEAGLILLVCSLIPFALAFGMDTSKDAVVFVEGAGPTLTRRPVPELVATRNRYFLAGTVPFLAGATVFFVSYFRRSHRRE